MSRREKLSPIRRRKEQIQRRDYIKRVSRRRFLYLFGGTTLGAAALIAAETSGITNLLPDRDEAILNTADNEQYVKTLESLLDVDKGFNRIQVAKKTYWTNSVNNPGSLTNTAYGVGFINERGENIEFALDSKGEPIPLQNGQILPPVKSAEYPEAQKIEAKHISNGNNHLFVYGISDTVSRIGANKNIVDNFLNEYYSDSKAAENSLHINFLPETQTPPSRTLPDNLGVPWEMDAIAFSRPLTLTDNSSTPLSKDMVHHTGINLVHLHNSAGDLGLPIAREFEGTLVNEMVNLLEHDQNTIHFNQLFEEGAGSVSDKELVSERFRFDAFYANEAPSSIVGELAKFDKEWADIILGGQSHRELIALISSEMERLVSR